MARFGKGLCIYVIGNLMVLGIASAVRNVMDGKDVLGNKKKPKQKTKVNWKGNVVLGEQDYVVV